MLLTPEEQRTIDTYNAHADSWSQAHDTTDFWHRELIRLHHHLPHGHILEIGSGGGRDIPSLLKLGYSYTGSDASSGLIEVVKNRFPEQSFYLQSVYELDFPDQHPFDGFWASAVLLHIPKSRIDEALNQIHHVTRHEGIGFISLKQGEGEKLEGSIETNDQRLFSYYQTEEFAEILKRNRFEILETVVNPMTTKTTWLSFIVKVLK